MRDSEPSARYSSVVMYCVNGESGSSLLIESTDSMIIYFSLVLCNIPVARESNY